MYVEGDENEDEDAEHGLEEDGVVGRDVDRGDERRVAQQHSHQQQVVATPRLINLLRIKT